jgi:hypothetical protein
VGGFLPRARACPLKIKKHKKSRPLFFTPKKQTSFYTRFIPKSLCANTKSLVWSVTQRGVTLAETKKLSTLLAEIFQAFYFTPRRQPGG